MKFKFKKGDIVINKNEPNSKFLKGVIDDIEGDFYIMKFPRLVSSNTRYYYTLIDDNFIKDKRYNTRLGRIIYK